ncbi:MAG: AfsR/SARP family transcriptional regulator [Myxococcota bacterium]
MAETARVLPLVRAGEGAHRATLLGAFRLTAAGGANLTPRARKTRALLAYVLMSPGPVPRERLAALLWGDRGDEQAKASLRQALYELRALAADPEPLLIVERDAVAVRPGACEADIERLMGLARAGAIGPLAAALEQGSLDLLADLYGVDREFDEWLRTEQVHVRARLAAAAVAVSLAAVAWLATGLTRRPA